MDHEEDFQQSPNSIPFIQIEDEDINPSFLTGDQITADNLDDSLFFTEHAAYEPQFELDLPGFPEELSEEPNESDSNSNSCSSAEISPKIEGKGTFEINMSPFKIQVITHNKPNNNNKAINSALAAVKSKWSLQKIDKLLKEQAEEKKKESKRTTFTKKQKDILDTWFVLNQSHPYPTISAIKELCSKTNLTSKQVRTYYVNKRIRHWVKKDEEESQKQNMIPVLQNCN